MELSTRSYKCSSRKGIAKEKTSSKTSMDNRGNTTKNEGKEKNTKVQSHTPSLIRRSKETALRQKRYGQTKNVKRLKDSPKD